MRSEIFHLFRNTPFGRENLMQAAYLCSKQIGMSLSVMIPESYNFVLGFETGEVAGSLDVSYIQRPETAQAHAEEILQDFHIHYSFFKPLTYAEPDLPVISNEWGIMSCPRRISNQKARIGLGYIGPKVRAIAKHASFPVFIPAMAYKPWNSVSIFYGGSPLGALVVREGIAIARLARVPFTIYTQLNGVSREECEHALSEADLLSEIYGADAHWEFFETGTLEENLYAVRHDSLAVVGAAGHRLMAELLFGSKLETIQATLPNPLVVVGPNCRPRTE